MEERVDADISKKRVTDDKVQGENEAVRLGEGKGRSQRWRWKSLIPGTTQHSDLHLHVNPRKRGKSVDLQD
jgi:hypothetical protein